MDWAKGQLEKVADGTVFLADRYHVARGRLGRVWCLYPGQLIVTFVLKPKNISKSDTTNHLNQLNMALTKGVAAVLEPYGVMIKKPNDFMIDGKKVGGILIEAVWHEGRVTGLVVGIAINCNNEFDEQDPLYKIATSLKQVTGELVDLDKLQKTLFASLTFWYKHWSL